jgi:hypothetical protein
MVFHKGTVYVIGGNDRKEVERLGNNNSWEEIASLNNARSFPAAVSMQGKLYVIGGIREQSQFAAIEVLIENEWNVVDVKLPNYLKAHACFFTPEHELVILGAGVVIKIDEGQNNTRISQSNCQECFLLNSWSYLEEENKVMVWGENLIWKYDIAEGTLEGFKKWNLDCS